MIRALHDELEAIEGGSARTEPIVTGEWRSVPAAPAEGYRAPRHLTDDPDADVGPAVVVTGVYGSQVLRPIASRLERLAGRELRILEVENRFFGGNTAVSGLMVGEDVERALASDDGPAGAYVLPDVALSGDRFLDDVDLSHVAAAAKAPVVVAEATVSGLLGAVR